MEANVPGLTLGAINNGLKASSIKNTIGNIAIVSINAPAIADGWEPSTKGGLPVATQANGVNAVRQAEACDRKGSAIAAVETGSTTTLRISISSG